MFNRLQLATEQIQFARNYTMNLLGEIRTEDWFRMPLGAVTHIAWQVGHLAMAQYRVGLERVRGTRSHDEDLISAAFLALFGGGSSPLSAEDSPSPAELLAVFGRVHQQCLYELKSGDITDAQLDLPILLPHKFVRTRLDSLLWCGQHEMLHAGQIGLLRRQLGYPASW